MNSFFHKNAQIYNIELNTGLANVNLKNTIINVLIRY